jgi:hypothetical protein
MPELTAAGGVLGGVMGALLGRSFQTRRLKDSPDLGTEITMTLDEDGLTASGVHEQARLAWPAFTRVVRLPDGIMLIRGRVLRWLPDEALEDAAPGAAVAFVQSKADLIEIL